MWYWYGIVNATTGKSLGINVIKHFDKKHCYITYFGKSVYIDENSYLRTDKEYIKVNMTIVSEYGLIKNIRYDKFFQLCEDGKLFTRQSRAYKFSALNAFQAFILSNFDIIQDIWSYSQVPITIYYLKDNTFMLDAINLSVVSCKYSIEELEMHLMKFNINQPHGIELVKYIL